MGAKKVPLLLAVTVSVIFCVHAVPGAVLAQEKYPTKPITLTIGYGAGGGTDVSTRPLAHAASKIIGQPIIVVNKPGGATAVAMAGLKNEKPDGYNIGTLGAGGFLAPLTRKVNYDVLKDFAPIVQFAIFQYGLVVRSDSPWKTFKEFIDYAKANPGKIRYSTSWVGGAQHLVMERLASRKRSSGRSSLTKAGKKRLRPSWAITWKRLPRRPPGKSTWTPDASGSWRFTEINE